MYMNNRQGWKEWFIAPGVDLKALTGVKSKTTLTECLKALKKLGLVDYKMINGGRTLYKMKSVSKNGPVTGTVTGTVGGNPLEELNKNTNGESEAPNGAPPPSNGKKIYEHNSKHYAAAKWLADDIAKTEERKVSRGEKILQSWAHSLFLLETKDGVPWKSIRATLVWARDDGFWSGNIRSAPKFRDKYNRLRSDMERAKSANGKGAQPAPQADMRLGDGLKGGATGLE